jgi:hypothetical protein
VLIILTNSDDATSDYLCEKLAQHAIEFQRLDTDTLARECSIGYKAGVSCLAINSIRIRSTDVAALILRRPKRLEFARVRSPEADHAADEWMEALEGFLAHIPFPRWINHPSANAAASHKIEQLTHARQMGLSTPDTLITQKPDAVKQFLIKHKYQVLTKPLAGGYIERDNQLEDTVIYTNLISVKHLKELNLISKCPTLFQQRIEKSSDVRICYLDGALTAVELIAVEQGQQRLDIRRDNMKDVKYRILEVPSAVKRSLCKLVRSYKLRFAAIDFVIDKRGNWVFLEINPNGQWAWLDLEGEANFASRFIQAFS